MNIFHIAWKEIKSDFRDTRTFVFMLAFPILLMLVLGTALSNAFTTGPSSVDIHVLYKDTTKGEAFSQFIQEVGKSGVHFKKVTEKINAKKEVQQNIYNGYVAASDKGITLFLNNRSDIEGNILEGVLSSYVDQYNITSEIMKVTPGKLPSAVTPGQKDFIQETSVLPNKQPGSMDYYAIAITTMIVLYGAMSASSLIVGERVRRTADRLIASPVRKSEIFIGKLLGSLVSNSICILLVVLCSKLLFKANWGDHIGLVMLVLVTEIIFAVSLGIGVGLLSKTNSAPKVIIMLVAQLASFFGGAYFKIDNPEGFLKFVTELSPLTWMNAGITKLIYENDFSAAISSMMINISGAVLFLLVSIIALQRREGL